LNVVSISLPPLRERREDIPVLVQHFLKKYAAEFGVEAPAITADALAQLQADSWPGNIRELENATRRLLLDARGLAIGGDAVRHTLAARGIESHSPASLASDAARLLALAQRGEIDDAHARLLAEAEREILTQAILLSQGNQAKAARWLGLSRLTLREKLTALGLRPLPPDGATHKD